MNQLVFICIKFQKLVKKDFDGIIMVSTTMVIELSSNASSSVTHSFKPKFSTLAEERQVPWGALQNFS